MAERIEPSDLLRAGMRAADLRMKVIANNVANINTPGYQRKEVVFEELLAEAMRTGDADEVKAVQPQIVTPSSPPAQVSGVDLETEMGALIDNSAKFRVYAALVKKLGSHKDMAINDTF
ncbi:MAG: flagellar biosynthesis protein FlgB [Planctomycetes bacterium]|nr:flagellar biosynthesis protein FlgB [Planctomycetota bacterium]